ncbi:MAG: hypothetical protein WBQ41_08575, partial [Solirubrobacterales bacterium]
MADPEECIQELLRGFTTYDRAVDVVSVFEMIFTASDTDLPGTVKHFERFPRVSQEDGDPLTPDFTILFDDQGGLVGEIARIALRDESVESLCRQIAKYDGIKQLPDGSKEAPTTHSDVLLLVPQTIGPAAVKRVITERAANEDHWYQPAAFPCVVQFGYDEDR